MARRRALFPRLLHFQSNQFDRPAFYAEGRLSFAGRTEHGRLAGCNQGREIR
jgi:hypothetical protein